ncbi:MAG: DNA lyase [Candidatus Proteinoplasmatales archaeon SG8-5]|nr:MAG: DNA lyase [Candidatus Proteinoplasmatales archaeon SG8-5]
MPYDEKAIQEVRTIHKARHGQITARLNEFREIWKSGSEETIFAELTFCLLTPQSKARLCWDKVEHMVSQDLLYHADADELSSAIDPVRFKHTKAKRITEARERFGPGGRTPIKGVIQDLPDAFEAREWLVKNVTGLGLKEASHFLRNIGKGEDLAILDRHILRNLKELGVINGVPSSLSRSIYLEIERKMDAFSRSIGIPMAHLDIVLWCRETGEIFK